MGYLRRCIASQFGLACLLALALGTGIGCKPPGNVIERADVKISDGRDHIRVSLVFASYVQADFAGEFALKDYGTAFMTAFAQPKPFEFGFDLDTRIFADANYANLELTTVLPNGVPTGLPNAVAEIRSAAPIATDYDLFAYVDVTNSAWLGSAAIFTAIDNKYFPPGMAVTQAFLRDAQGRPAVQAYVFGPSVDEGGHLKRAGGIAVFANVRQLLE